MTSRGSTSGQQSDEVVPLEDYSRALDEIYELRRALAYEAGGLVVHGGYKSFPKSRRHVLEAQVERMRLAAQGKVQHAYGDKATAVLRYALREAGAAETLTRSAWESEHPRRQS